MAWTVPDETGLDSRLLTDERGSYDEDAVEEQLEEATVRVRSYVRRSGTTMADAGVPPSCLWCVYAIVAYDLVADKGSPVGEARRRAVDDALDFLGRVADGSVLVETGSSEEGAKDPAPPSPASRIPDEPRYLA